MSNKKRELPIEEQLLNLPEPEINVDYLHQCISSVKRAARNKKRDNENIADGRLFTSLFRTRFIYAAASFSIGIMLTASVFSSSVNALPGNWLYPIKLISEKVAYVLKMTPSGKAELSITFSEERLNEIAKSYDLSGNVDKGILELLIKEAQNALLLSMRTDADTSNKLNTKIKELNQRQIAVLAEYEKNASGEAKELFKQYGARCQGLMRGRYMRMQHQ